MIFRRLPGRPVLPHSFISMPDRRQAGGVDCPPPGTPPLCLLAVQAGAERSCEAARSGKKMNALMWRLRPLTKGIPSSGPFHVTPSPEGWPSAPSRRSHTQTRGRGPPVCPPPPDGKRTGQDCRPAVQTKAQRTTLIDPRPCARLQWRPGALQVAGPLGGAGIATGSDITAPSAKVMAGSSVARIGRAVTIPDVPGPLRVGQCAAVTGRAANAPKPALPRRAAQDFRHQRRRNRHDAREADPSAQGRCGCQRAVPARPRYPQGRWQSEGP